MNHPGETSMGHNLVAFHIGPLHFNSVVSSSLPFSMLWQYHHLLRNVIIAQRTPTKLDLHDFLIVQATVGAGRKHNSQHLKADHT
jgi:hypothetical protein